MNNICKQILRGLILISSLYAAIVSADQLDIHPKPLEVSGNADVRPNVMFILDDSGSMAWTYMPNAADSFRNDYGYQSSHCNAVYFDPNITYTPPYDPNQPGDSFPNSNFTSAEDDGFNPDNSTNRNLNNSFVANRYLPAAANGWYGGATYGAGEAVYYEYTGAETDKDYQDDPDDPPSVFHQECDTPLANNTNVFTKHRLNTTVNATIDVGNVWNGGGIDSVSSVRICPTCTNLLSATATGNNSNALATSIEDNINNNAGATGVTATRAGSVVTLTANNASEATYRGQPLLVTANGWFWYPDTGWQNNIVRVDAFADNDPDKLTNFANWYSYYRTRMSMMKSSVSLAFASIDNRYRVGLMTLNTANTYVGLDEFALGNHKDTWYAQLSRTNAQPRGTPLRSSLANAGRLYAGKGIYGNNDDPVEYACQANFSLVTTDGYWNTDQANDIQDINGNAIGNLDSADAGTPRPLREGTVETSGTLADIAKYYYDTDIRDGGNTNNFNNCIGALGQNVCGSVGDHLQQNMTTLSLGLGADGVLTYSADYKDQTVGDFADLKTGAENWPEPGEGDNLIANIDDLWHAAVNGGGTYYSAQDPTSLKDALIKSLAEIQVSRGNGSAAAASSLAPVAGDNFAYLASYRMANGPVSLPATGNLEARTVNLTTFEISKTASWCVESIAPDCTAPDTAETVGNDWYCVKSDSAANCANGTVGLGTNPTGCYVQANTCRGKLPTQVRNNSRNIYTSNGSNLVALSVANVDVALWDAQIQNMTQWPNIKDKTPSGTGTTLENESANARVGYLIDYLKGQTTYENETVNTNAERKLFRDRELTLGDITESEPKYLGQTYLAYPDTGFDAFKTQLASRQKAVVVGANDGMLHAFNGATGNELWAYIPSMVLNKMPVLANEAYGTSIQHENFVNGSPKEVAVCTSNPCTGNWRAILVGGLNAGGRGYYALDTTNPASPQLLWEISADTPGFGDLGLTYGEPAAVQLDTGKWVIMFSSGYNNGRYQNDPSDNILNTPQGDGRGHLYIVDPMTGALLRDIATPEGTSTTPVGLAQISPRVVDPFLNNRVKHVYAGDLEGNIWRFDPNAGNVRKVADNGGQPITTKLEIGLVKGKVVLFVGTGKYLELSDLTSNDVQSLYAFGVDEGNPTPPTIDLRGTTLIDQTLTDNGNSRSVDNPQTVDFSTNAGWRIDFLPGGERVDVDPILSRGLLMVATRVPLSTSCAGGGFGWTNYFDYKTGSSAFPGSDLVSEKHHLPIQGFNLFYDPQGEPTVNIVDSEGNTTKVNSPPPGAGGGTRDTLFYKYDDQTYGRRSIWRELIKE